MKEDLIQIRSSLVIKSHTVLGDLLTILLVISIYKSQSTNNACQSIQLHLQIRAGTIVPSLLVFVLVFTTSTVWFGLSCWKTKRWPRSSFAADCLSCALSSSHILLHDSFLDKIPSSRHTEGSQHHNTLTTVFHCGDCGVIGLYSTKLISACRTRGDWLIKWTLVFSVEKSGNLSVWTSHSYRLHSTRTYERQRRPDYE